ncbi:MAG: Asp-tRNA(Asn)/Glu-tRNA(Gln) amidotransferase subunit GatB [Pseudomonadota bacterium]
MEYEPVIGLEVHAQLLTKSKLFCACSTDFGGEPNTNVCPVCLGLPGSLPVLNRQAVTFAVQAGLALGCTIHEKSIFARKNYFYPDLPKGYQISQFEEPIATHGHLDIEVDGVARRVGITRAHMEEDAGKNVHGVAGDSLVDLNRAGTPLCEIVGEPDLRSSAEAAAYLRAMRDLLVFIGVNDGNLEEGSFRCDANVSIRPVGTEKFGTRCELKNINSFKFVQRAIDAEIIRQTAILDSGGKVKQETRSFDPDTGLTQTLRAKDDAHDYRYFPEPDLPPLRVDPAFIAAQRCQLTRAAGGGAQALGWKSSGLTLPTAQTLTQHPRYVSFFEAVCRAFDQPVKVANFVANEVLRGAKSHGLEATFTVSPEQVAELLSLVESGENQRQAGQEVFAALENTSKSARSIDDERGLRVVSDSASLEKLCQQLSRKVPESSGFSPGREEEPARVFHGSSHEGNRRFCRPEVDSAPCFEKLLGGEA